MLPERSIEQVLHDLIMATTALAAQRDLAFGASLPGPASAAEIAAAERFLRRPFMREHHELLKHYNGLDLNVSAPDGRIVPRTLRVFSCEEMLEETTRLRRNGYNLAHGYVVGAWDGYGDRFIVMLDEDGCDGIVDASQDDPTSFAPPFAYPDIRTWLSSEMPRLYE